MVMALQLQTHCLLGVYLCVLGSRIVYPRSRSKTTVSVYET